MIMRISKYSPEGVKVNAEYVWKYCKSCGFCHSERFDRCLAQVKSKIPRR